MIEIQVALDRIDLDRAVEITRAVADRADGIEVGTSLIKRYGMDAVRAVVAAAAQVSPTAWVLADLKTADDAAYEFGLAFDAGAKSATVLGMVSPATVATAAQVARDRGGEAVVDLMLLDDARRTELAGRVGQEVRLAAHVGKDDQAGGASPLTQFGPWAQHRRLAVAGGLGLEDVPAIAHIPELRLIVGSVVTKAANPRAVLDLLNKARRATITQGERSS